MEGEEREGRRGGTALLLVTTLLSNQYLTYKSFCGLQKLSYNQRNQNGILFGFQYIINFANISISYGILYT